MSVSIHREQARLRAVIYLRLSVAGDEDSTSLVKMEKECRDRAASEGFEVAAVLTDDGISGGVRRAKADRALAMLRSGEADVIVVWKWDRWSRQGIIAVGDLMETLLKTAPRTRFLALRDGLDSNQPMFPIFAALMAEQARMERENTKIRVSSTVQHLVREGRYYGGITPFGWRPERLVDGRGKPVGGYRLGQHDEQMALLQEVIARVIAGEPVHAICKELNQRIATATEGARAAEDEDVRERAMETVRLMSPEGKGWSPGTMRRLLRNPVLRGFITYRSDWKKGEMNLVLGADNVPLRPHEPALSDDDWYQLQDALDVRSYKTVKMDRSGHLLKGLAKCDACGKNLGKRNHHLACSRHRKDFDCPGCIIDRERTEVVVTEAFLARYGDMPVMIEVEVERDTRRVREIIEALEVVGRKVRDADTEEQEQEWLARKWDLRRELKQLETTVNGGPEIIRQETGATYADGWATATLEQRHDWLASLVHEIRVTKSHGKRTWDAERVRIVFVEDVQMGIVTEEMA